MQQPENSDSIDMENKQTISIVVHDLSSAAIVRAFLLSEAFDRLNFSVEIVGFQCGNALYSDPPPGISLKPIPLPSQWQWWQAKRELLANIEGDILLALKLRPLSFGLGLFRKYRRHCPLILDIDDWELSWHDGGNYRYRPTPKQLARDILKSNGALRNPNHPFYLQQIEKWVKFADAVTVHNTFLQQRFGGTYVPNGKDTDLFDPEKYDRAASRKKYGLDDYFVLMFPGAPRPYKGVEDILAALDRLEDPRMRLAIVGGSPYDNYDDLLSQKWGRWLLKLPRSPYNAMPEIVAAADAIVVPQRDVPAAKAQFPLKITDGMAMAKPVLATRVGDIPDILGDTGYLVDPESPAQLADAIRAIAKDPDLARERGQKARSRCLDRYSIAAMSTALAKVIDTVQSQAEKGKRSNT